MPEGRDISVSDNLSFLLLRGDAEFDRMLPHVVEPFEQTKCDEWLNTCPAARFIVSDDDLSLNAAEREVIRRAFMSRFNDAPSVTEGFHVKRWATGPNKGQPKLTTAVQAMLDRGLITIVDAGFWPRALFTDKGFRALKRVAADNRALDPERHRLLLDELATIPE